MKNIFFPSYTIGEDAYASIPSICSDFGSSAVIIGGRTALEKAEKSIISAVKNSITFTDSLWYGGDATFENADKLLSCPEVEKADMIFAVGGGRAVDTVKCTAEKLQKTLFTFPTLASNCAPVTAVCAMYHEDHSFRGVWYRSRPPYHCFINTRIIAEAPSEYFWAGIGDALSKQYEVTFSARNDATDYVCSLGTELAASCSEGLLQYGEQAFHDIKQQKATEAAERVIQNIIISTGLISNCIPEDYNSSLAHALYNSHVGIPHARLHLHGAVVCYGVLVLLTMDGQLEERNRVFSFCRKLGLPSSLADIEMDKGPIEEYLDMALSKPDLRKTPYPVTKDMVRQAIMDLETYGKTCQNC